MDNSFKACTRMPVTNPHRWGLSLIPSPPLLFLPFAALTIPSPPLMCLHFPFHPVLTPAFPHIRHATLPGLKVCLVPLMYKTKYASAQWNLWTFWNCLCQGLQTPKTSLAMGLAMKTLTYAIVKTNLCC